MRLDPIYRIINEHYRPISQVMPPAEKRSSALLNPSSQAKAAASLHSTLPASFAIHPRRLQAVRLA